MKLEQQVTSLELSKRLKELGVKQESLFHWYQAGKEFVVSDKNNIGSWRPKGEHVEFPVRHFASAFTVAELGEMIKTPIEPIKTLPIWTGAKWSLYSQTRVIVEAVTEADARAKMLVYLIENKLLKL